MASFGRNPVKLKREFDDTVNAERERRWERGTDIDVSGYGWVALQGRPEDRAFIAGLAQTADTAMRWGISQDYDFTDRENFQHILTGLQVIELFMKGAAYVSAVHFSSVVLKAQPSLTLDVTDDAHWPAPGVAP